jgi:hypothetical protein
MRHTLITIVALGTLSTVAFTAQSDAQGRRQPRPARDEQVQNNAFEWRGELAQGQRLIVRNLNGRIAVEPAGGRTLDIVANKRWRRGTPSDVKIEATRVNGGRDVLLCARWTTTTECTESSYQTRGTWSNDNDTQVEFIIKLPAGSNAVLNTTNGDIEVTGASGAIEANTTNGAIVASSSDGPVEAHTTNGDIEVRMTKIPAKGTSYHTTNGSVTVSLPEGADANIKARTTNGRINSEFALSVSGVISGRSLQGTIGKGGPLLDIATTNGTIRIEKR